MLIHTQLACNFGEYLEKIKENSNSTGLVSCRNDAGNKWLATCF